MHAFLLLSKSHVKEGFIVITIALIHCWMYSTNLEGFTVIGLHQVAVSIALGFTLQ